MRDAPQAYPRMGVAADGGTRAATRESQVEMSQLPYGHGQLKMSAVGFITRTRASAAGSRQKARAATE